MGNQSDCDKNRLEADLLFEVGSLQPVEMESGQTVTRNCVQPGQASGRFAVDETLPPWLIYGGNETYERSEIRVIAWADIAPAAVLPPLTF